MSGELRSESRLLSWSKLRRESSLPTDTRLSDSGTGLLGGGGWLPHRAPGTRELGSRLLGSPHPQVFVSLEGGDVVYELEQLTPISS